MNPGALWQIAILPNSPLGKRHRQYADVACLATQDYFIESLSA